MLKDRSQKQSLYFGILLCGIVILSIIGRYYYSVEVYHETFSAGDATQYVIRAYYFLQYYFGTGGQIDSGELYTQLFGAPFLVPYLFALFSKLSGVPVEQVPFLVSSLNSLALVCLLYVFVSKVAGRWVAWWAVLFYTLNSYVNFYATEPLKSMYVLMFFLAALLLKDKARWRSIFLVSCTYFVHNTGLVYIALYGLLLLWDMVHMHYPTRRIRWISWISTGVVFVVMMIHPLLVNKGLYTWGMQAYASSATLVAKNTMLEEVRAFFENMTTGFAHSGVQGLVTGMQRRIGSSLVWLTGLCALCLLAVRPWRRRYRSIVVMLLFLFVFFSVKRTASSHFTRYPSYLVWLFYACIVLGIALAVDKPIRGRPFAGLGLLAIGFLSILLAPQTFYSTYVGGLREIYRINKEAGQYIGRTIEVDSQNKMLLMGWPETMRGIIQSNPSYAIDNYITYGWKYPEELEKIDTSFLQEHRIAYFVYENTGQDYFLSYEVVKKALAPYIELVEVFLEGAKSIEVYRVRTELF